VRQRRHRKDGWWTAGLRAVDVGRQLRLVPFWQPRTPDSNRKELIIDPGPSFGAGDHPTTVMALELLEEAMERFKGEGVAPSLLDVGTGTGVLALAGKALGSCFTVALDPDPAAAFTARRNFRLNGWGTDGAGDNGPCLFVGGIEAVGGCFDLVLANLVAPVLMRLLQPLTTRAKRRLVLSGIAEPMADQTFAAYRGAGFRIDTRLSRQGWNAALFVTEAH